MVGAINFNMKNVKIRDHRRINYGGLEVDYTEKMIPVRKGEMTVVVPNGQEEWASDIMNRLELLRRLNSKDEEWRDWFILKDPNDPRLKRLVR